MVLKKLLKFNNELIYITVIYIFTSLLLSNLYYVVLIFHVSYSIFKTLCVAAMLNHMRIFFNCLTQKLCLDNIFLINTVLIESTKWSDKQHFSLYIGYCVCQSLNHCSHHRNRHFGFFWFLTDGFVLTPFKSQINLFGYTFKIIA